ncbi:MAG TPA: tRNA lysidine(34) synthetase TilS [Gemmatimonadaceae bacterium]|nr:tRNA lysidine(34) synthetase TilS [Gemmatimonadaceae bacterium]
MLAVSGGLDSMSLLDLATSVRERRACSLVVATFDHASGTYSTRAAGFVTSTALSLGLPVVVGRNDDNAPTEAAWRAARWGFLRSVARATSGVILTAHTLDDQVETVLMRALRGAGARGLAGLRAVSDVRRPLGEVRRADLNAYAKTRCLRWLEDPTNSQPTYLRNRIRRDLLPSLLRARPSLESELIAIGDRAAEWRDEVAALVDAGIRSEIRNDATRVVALDVLAADLASYPNESLCIIWPELAARVGLALDRRGTRRAAKFTIEGRVGARIQVSGGWELTRSRSRFELRRALLGEVHCGAQPLQSPMTWDRWTFAATTSTPAADPWRAALPRGDSLWVRAWRPGDRLTIRLGDHLITRKVRYFLSDAGISGHIRARWPVVLVGNEIVWIPGVRRSDAASARSGGPVVTYACDYLDRRS